jgi:hypothetical protein
MFMEQAKYIDTKIVPLMSLTSQKGEHSYAGLFSHGYFGKLSTQINTD